jgi:hypothetical protein
MKLANAYDILEVREDAYERGFLMVITIETF